MANRVGTSGWFYDEWKGRFYPEDLASGDMLSFYAERLGTVEVNDTFYRLPKRDVLAGWTTQVPETFRFVLETSRRITHQAKLGPDAREPLEFLVRHLAELGSRFGALLVQTPPGLKADRDLLERFLEWIPEGVRVAFEFRSRSWFDDDVIALMAERGHAFAAADTCDPEKDPPLAAGGGWCFARLRREDYDEASLADRAGRLLALPVQDRFVFFMHEDDAAGPVLAARFARLLEEAA